MEVLNSQLSSGFKHFQSDLLNTLNENELKSFSNLNDDEQRLKYVYQLKRVHDYKIVINSGSKSANSAKQLKDFGNKAFQANQFKAALDLYSKCIMKQPHDSPRCKKKTHSEKSELKNGTNKQYPAASNVVCIKEGQEVGRYAEANSDIKPGDFLLKEKPYCSILLDQYSKTHCFQCFLRVVAAYPCPGCSNVVFCGKKCQQEALQTHHRIECSILPNLWQSGVSVTCLMSLRIITQQSLQYFLQLRPSLNNTQNKMNEKPYKSSDYLRLANLVSHATERTSEDFLHRTFMAIFLLRCLQQTEYFPQQNNKKKDCGEIFLTEEEQFIGGLILKHLQILQFNSHEVSEMIVDGKDRRTVFIGAAVYPTLALFNHSCNPGIVRYQKGTEVIVRAVRNIRSGEMIAENYGPMFTQTPRDERQSTLRSQYWFYCNCEACTDNWPTLENMDRSVMRFRCECDSIVCIPIDTNQFMFPCHKCNQHINIFKGLKVLQDTDIMFRLGKSLVDEGNTAAALHKFTELLNLLDSTLVPPFQDYHLCQQELRTCMVSCGNVYFEKLSP